LGTPEGRRSERVLLKRRSSLVVNLDRDQKRVRRLVLDSWKEGYRLRGSFHLRRGQFVEIVFDPAPFRSEHCHVVWVGKSESKQEGEIGLETV
jgi:hypothetical protein